MPSGVTVPGALFGPARHGPSPSTRTPGEQAGRARGWDRRLVWMLVLGTALRLAIVPWTHGQDFIVWDKASTATLHGIDMYSHHAGYPGGPFAYLPLFIDLELPFQWLSMHVGAPFTVLGKVPVLAGDLLTAILLAVALRRRGVSRRGILIGTAAFYLNPLVLYNGAFYGRFDTLACGLLLAAILLRERRGAGSRAAALLLGLAIAAKTFPAFVVLGFLRPARRVALRVSGLVVLVLLVLTLPYLAAPRSLVVDVLLYDLGKSPQALSWQQALLGPLGAPAATALSIVLLAGFAAACWWLTRIRDVSTYAMVVLLLFPVFSKVVLEQYLIWAIPLLIVHLATHTGTLRRAGIGVLVLLTATGCLVNPYVHPFGTSPLPVAVLLAAALLGYVVLVVRSAGAADPVRRPGG